MKLSVSTLGCPEWTLEEILERALEYGYDAVELRGLGPHLDLAESPTFADIDAREDVLRLLRRAGLRISAVDSSVTLGERDRQKRAETLAHGRKAIDIAAALRAPYVRVFGGGEDSSTSSLDRMAGSLLELCEHATNRGGVMLVLETHDCVSRGEQVAEVLRRARHPLAGALWDLHHPYRQGESPQETWDALGPWVRLVHVKDSKPGGTYCLLGEGDVPIREMLGILKAGGYAGDISLEWEKRWIPELLEPEVVFPQYASTLRQYLAELGA